LALRLPLHRVCAIVLIAGAGLSACAGATGSTTPTALTARPPAPRLSMDETLKQALNALQLQLPPVLKAEGIETVAALEIVGANGRITAFDRFVLERVTQTVVGKIRVVERQRLEQVRDEIKLNLSDVIDEKKAIEAGRLLGADGLMTGTSFERASEVEIVLRVIASRTGQVVSTASLHIAKDADARGLLSQQVARETEGRRPPLELAMFVTARRGRDDRFVREHDILKSGEHFQVQLRPNAECFVYVILVEQGGKTEVIFQSRTRVRPRVWATIPARDRWWFLDNRPGVETIYGLASYEPLDITTLAAQIQRGTRGEDVRPSTGSVGSIYQEVIIHQRSSRVTQPRAPQGPPPSLVRGPSMRTRGIAGETGGQATDVTLPEDPQADGVAQTVQGYATVMSSVTYIHE
jgi:hypothetical protein